MSEIELIDAILRAALELQRLSGYEENQAIAVLEELEEELKQLLASRTLSDRTTKQIEGLIDDAQKAIDARYATIPGLMDTHGLVLLVADRTVEAMQAAIPEAKSVTSETLKSLSKDIMIDGAPASDWWAKQAEDTAFKFAAQVRQGVVNGENQERIVSRIVGKAGEPGIMEVSKRNARALVHSAVMSAANAARLETYRNNGRFIEGIRWLATLDSHVCWTAETLVTMADGTLRRIAEIREGDIVIGGVTGEPKRVVSTMKRLAQSSVVIHCDGRYVGRATQDHPILTPKGWREAGSFDLSAQLSEREVLCRHYEASECAIPGASSARRDGLDARDLPGLAQIRGAVDDDHRQGHQLRDGICDGSCAHRATEHESPAGVQHDEWRGWSGRRDARGGVATEGCRQESIARVRPQLPGIEQSHDCAAMEGPRAEGQNECCPRKGAVRTTSIESRMGEGTSGEGRGDNASEMARPGVSCENGCAEGSCHTCRDAQGGGCETTGANDAGAAFRGCQEVLGHTEGVSVGILTSELIDGEVEVYNLTIEEDHTFVAGGVITHNCLTCSALDHASWNLEGEPIRGTTLDLRFPPAHWNCRCVISPVAKGLNDIFGKGLDEMIAAKSMRASKDGPVATTTFNDFLKRQSPEFVDRVLGAKRAEMFRSGKMTLRDFVSGTGRPLSLDQIRAA